MSSSSAHSRSRSLLLTSTLLPIDTNAEMPALRCSASAAMAIPTPPDWAATAIPPGRNRCAVNVALSPHRVETTPRQFGPDDAHAVGAGGGEQLVLAPPAVVVLLGEAGRDDDRRGDAGSPALVDDADDGGGRDGDDRQVGHRVQVADPADATATPPIAAADGWTTLMRPANDCAQVIEDPPARPAARRGWRR